MSEFGPGVIDGKELGQETDEKQETGNRFMQWLRNNQNNKVLRVLVPLLLGLSVSGAKAEKGQVSKEASIAQSTASLAEKFTGAKREEVTVDGVRYARTDCPFNSLNDELTDYLLETPENLAEIGTPDHTERATRQAENQMLELAENAPNPAAVEAVAPIVKKAVEETVDNASHKNVTISRAAERMAEYQEHVERTLEQFTEENRDPGSNPHEKFAQNFRKVVIDTLADANKTGETNKAYRQLESYVTNTLEEEMAVKVKDAGFDSVVEALDFFFTNIDDATTQFALNYGRGREAVNPYVVALQHMKDNGQITDRQLSVLGRAHAEGTKEIFSWLDESVKSGSISNTTSRLITSAHLAMEAFACINNTRVYTGNETLLLPRVYLKKGGEGARVFFQFIVSPDGKPMHSGKPPKFTLSGFYLGANERF